MLREQSNQNRTAEIQEHQGQEMQTVSQQIGEEGQQTETEQTAIGTAGSDTPDFQAEIKQINPESDILAIADVRIGNLLTVLNVKIKEDDYGYSVTMPKTSMKDTGRYKDAVYFADRAMKEKFDETVTKAYQDFIHENEMEDRLDDAIQEVEDMEEPEEGMEQEAAGMSMEM